MRALISVSDKTGIVSLARRLSALGVTLISTGGTYKVLKENGIPVTAIDEVTQFPEMLDGRVKTLHPKIHGGLLALRQDPEHMATCVTHGIEMIDFVIVNLYPFKATIQKPNVTLDEAIENIDIGGPSMIRSAAKNYQSVAVIVNPDRYDAVLTELEENHGKLSQETRNHLCAEAFMHTAQYDALIASYLSKVLVGSEGMPELLSPALEKVSELRYGENPHQKAAFYRISMLHGLPEMEQLHGKELSYNNWIDIEAAWQIAQDFELPGAAIIKHTNPCGAAVGDSLSEAYALAYAADPTSAFGSIIGLNRQVDEATAKQISETFVEVVVAPGYDDEALEILTKKTAIRLLKCPHFDVPEPSPRYRYVAGGFLVQEPDLYRVTAASVTIPTKVKPTKEQLNDAIFGMTLVKHVKSNAIVVVKNGQSLGIGAGQMSRIESVEIALRKSGNQVKGAVLASDAFFPFQDSVEMAYKAGISAIIQPGGSKRDQESIDFCDRVGIPMIFTGIRHFKH
jgi:phosphoribosylaminoimidazolecarboxamide formyltransferase / IMP cyclohydrolase